MIQVFDVLVGIKDPVLTSRVCKENLTAIAPHQQGKFITVGNSIGNIFMLESSQALTTNAPNDKNLMSMVIFIIYEDCYFLKEYFIDVLVKE